ncbi:SURF1 family protein [Candidatus Ruthia endofausta]|uniref:SURF1-like protein n=1 Tax=Candidatus Ruthia endofausta TaxID=2738852 RepID=A0A6N0HQL5_9GAMM|nr:SURF1 family protein [Candidatus Ruthia endofausta]QKQ24616.1 SURF1 family protein [Candidatus Ruthia endofausta]
MIKRTIFIPAVLILLSIYGLASLGFWQLERADEKRAIEHGIILAQQNPTQLVTNIDELLNKEHYQVLLKGHYDTNKQFIYDNQIVKGNAGYYVLTPFILSDKTAILVNRGFVPWYGKREQLTDIKLDNLPRVIKVELIKPVERIRLKQQPIKPNFPILIQSLNLDELSTISDYQIITMLARLDVKASDGFFRQWQPFYGSIDKHLGYALQWFLMALVLGIIALKLLIKN